MLQVFRKPICLKRNSISSAGIFRDKYKILSEGGRMFDIKILEDLSCKHFKATTSEFGPVITVKEMENGALM